MSMIVACFKPGKQKYKPSAKMLTWAINWRPYFPEWVDGRGICLYCAFLFYMWFLSGLLDGKVIGYTDQLEVSGSNETRWIGVYVGVGLVFLCQLLRASCFRSVKAYFGQVSRLDHQTDLGGGINFSLTIIFYFLLFFLRYGLLFAPLPFVSEHRSRFLNDSGVCWNELRRKIDIK